jgi:MFS family permease
MPYLILYYEKSLGMADYVLIMAPAIVLASVVTALWGKVYDKKGFNYSYLFSFIWLCLGYIILYLFKGTALVFIGSLLMMCGYLSGMAVFGAIIREQIPENMSGRFQGLRIIGQVLIPGVIGPAIGAWVLRDAAQIENSDGTFSFLPDKGIWSAALVAAVVVLAALAVVFSVMKKANTLSASKKN